MHYTTTKYSDHKYVVQFHEHNNKQETLSLELVLRYDDKAANSLVQLWHKKGYIDKPFTSYWSIDTFMKDSEGYSWAAYNPQLKKDEHSNRHVIDFEWLLEGTEAHFEALIKETYKRFMGATGKSATQEKRDAIYAYAEKEALEVVTKMPEGWIKVDTVVAPSGSTYIYDQKPTLKLRREKGLHKKLLIL